jgi:hypothetical protein
MTQDPMVSALQGPPDPAMDALFQQPPPSVLTEQMLRQKGLEMLQDPNRPQYNPNNVDRPMVPGEEGSPFQGILNPRGWGTMVQQPHLQHMAGEVVPFPITPQMADLRRMNHEDMLKEMQRLGPARVEQYNRNWPPISPVPGPGANQ